MLCFGVNQPESLLFKGSQSVEQLIRNEKVGGSIPLFGTTYKSRKVKSCLGFFVAHREYAGKCPKRSDAMCMKLGVHWGVPGGTSTSLGGTFYF